MFKSVLKSVSYSKDHFLWWTVLRRYARKKNSLHERRDVPKDMLGQPGAAVLKMQAEVEEQGKSTRIFLRGHPVNFHHLAGSSLNWFDICLQQLWVNFGKQFQFWQRQMEPKMWLMADSSDWCSKGHLAMNWLITFQILFIIYLLWFSSFEKPKLYSHQNVASFCLHLLRIWFIMQSLVLLG